MLLFSGIYNPIDSSVKLSYQQLEPIDNCSRVGFGVISVETLSLAIKTGTTFLELL